MKTALTKLIFVFFLLLISWNADLYGQYKKKIMFVPYHSQQTSRWCWAASMKMIMDFHNPSGATTFSQCDLVKRLFKITTATAHSTIDRITCCVICSGNPPHCSDTSTCSNDKQRQLAQMAIAATTEGSAPAISDSYDLIFSSYGYSSVQKINWRAQPMSWREITQQIDDCRPFIINLWAAPNSDSVNRLEGDHALVVTGYEQLSPTNTSGNGVYCLDPWVPRCCGDQEEAYFPYNIFTRLNSIGVTTLEGTGLYYVNRVLSTVHSIRPDTLFDNYSNCESCNFLDTEIYPKENFFREETVRSTSDVDVKKNNNLARQVRFVNKNLASPPEEPTRLADLLNQKGAEVMGYQKGTGDEKPFTVDSIFYERTLQSDPTYYDAPVQYLSAQRINRSYFLACLFPPRRLSKVLLSGYAVVDVVSSKVDTNLVSTLQKTNGGAWELRKISTYTSIDSTVQATFENSNRTVGLSNARNNRNTDARTYTLIKYFPEQYEFFSFKMDTTDRTTYLVPAQHYPELELTQHVAYREQKVLRKLREDTRAIDRLLRRLPRREPGFNAANEQIGVKNLFDK